jgi:hypothetical protein
MWCAVITLFMYECIRDRDSLSSLAVMHILFYSLADNSPQFFQVPDGSIDLPDCSLTEMEGIMKAYNDLRCPARPSLRTVARPGTKKRLKAPKTQSTSDARSLPPGRSPAASSRVLRSASHLTDDPLRRTEALRVPDPMVPSLYPVETAR